MKGFWFIPGKKGSHLFYKDSVPKLHNDMMFEQLGGGFHTLSFIKHQKEENCISLGVLHMKMFESHCLTVFEYFPFFNDPQFISTFNTHCEYILNTNSDKKIDT